MSSDSKRPQIGWYPDRQLLSATKCFNGDFNGARSQPGTGAYSDCSITLLILRRFPISCVAIALFLAADRGDDFYQNVTGLQLLAGIFPETQRLAIAVNPQAAAAAIQF